MEKAKIKLLESHPLRLLPDLYCPEEAHVICVDEDEEKGEKMILVFKRAA